MRLLIGFTVLSWAIASAACAFKEENDYVFGDQHFKTAISLIEPHKVRFGKYPDILKDLKFVGEWDKIALANVEYKRSGSGYDLNLLRGWVGKPDLRYPDEFWKGLGLIRSNARARDH